MPTDVEKWKSEVYGNEIREHLFEFAEEGWDAIPEDEHDAGEDVVCLTTGHLLKDPDAAAKAGAAASHRTASRRRSDAVVTISLTATGKPQTIAAGKRGVRRSRC